MRDTPPPQIGAHLPQISDPVLNMPKKEEKKDSDSQPTIERGLTTNSTLAARGFKAFLRLFMRMICGKKTKPK